MYNTLGGYNGLTPSAESLVFIDSSFGVESTVMDISSITGLEYSSSSFGLLSDSMTIESVSSLAFDNSIFGLSSQVMNIENKPPFKVNLSGIRLLNVTKHYRIK